MRILVIIVYKSKQLIGEFDMSLEINYASRNVGDVFYTLRTEGVLNGAVPCDGATYYVEDFASLPDKSNIAYLLANIGDFHQIGRASCRERV